MGVDYSYQFNGIFDGQGHIISNLQVSGAGYAGLFGRLGPSATVKNLGIINSSISATSDSFAISGGIAGENRGTIENCYNTGTVTGTMYSGGIAGLNSKTITNCYNTGDVTAKAGLLTHSGGIVGQNFVGPITNCYNTGDVTATAKSTDDNAFSGGIAGLNSGGPITNCYNTGDVTATADSINTIAYSGGIAGYNAEGTIENCYNTGEVTATATATSTNSSAYSGGVVGKNDENSTVQSCYSHESSNKKLIGEGTTSDTCKFFGDDGNLSGENKSLLKALNEWVKNFNVGNPDDYRYWMGPFIQNEKYPVFTDWYGEAERLHEADPGNFDYILSKNDKGVYEITNGYQLALIAANDNLNKNYVLSHDIDLSRYEWRPIGKDDSNQFNGTFDGQGHTISNLSVNVNSKSGDVYAGLFGYLGSNATVKNLGMINSKVSANVVNGSAGSGGIAAYNEGTITNCYNTGTVNSPHSSGGIAAHNDGTITNCYNTGTVTGSYSGGIAEYNISGTITNCYNTGDVTGTDYSGGIVGNQGTWTTNDGTITNCYNTGDVTGTDYSGGIVGYNISGTITNCYNTGTVTGTGYSGGIAGVNPSTRTITNCYNTGTVTGSNSGGIVGKISAGTIANCYNTGDVTGTDYSGGIAGHYIGLGTFTNCYNTGDVTGTDYSGGIVGHSTGAIKNCYNTGTVTGSNSGGIVGAYGAITNCYYLKSCVSNGKGGGEELDQDAMTGSNLLGVGSDNNLNKDKDGDDITDSDSKPWSPDIFNVNNGYPILADVPTQIDPNSTNTPPQSAVFITLGIEKVQAENYLKPFILTNGNEVAATINCLNDQAEKITSYQWYTMNDKGVFIEVDEKSLPGTIQETYYVKVTINGYSYTSLTRTVSDTFIVMFDSNDGSDVKSIIVSNGKTIAEPEDPIKTGYTFEGWYTSDDKKWNFSSDKVTNNMTLYAVWTPIPEPIYTLCLNSNDSTLQTKRYSGTYGTEVTLKSASDFGWNDECKFIEWNSKSDGSGVSYKEGDKFSLGSEVWNLYAIWSDSSYHTVSFDSNGGNSIPSQSVQDGYRASEPTDPEKQGHSFKHWSLNGTKYDFNQSVKEDMTLKAEYEIISYKVTFYYNGDVYYSTQVDYNTSLGDRMPSLPSDKDSWNTSENGKGSNFTSDSLITSDISVYAVSENSITSILIIGGSAAAILAAIAAWMFMRSRYN